MLERAEPILHVTHQEDEYSWSFIGSSDGTRENCKLIALCEAVQLDPSVLQLADLPIGWRAVRDTVESPWKREAIDEA